MNHATDIKYLGIIIDEKLKFAPHVDKVVKKISSHAAVMLRMRKVMHRKHLLQYYNSYIKPIIQYGILIYGCTHKSILNRILMVQKRITRLIFFKRFKDPVTDVMTEHKIYTVYELQYYELLKEVVKNLNGWSCLNLLPSNVPSRSTRLQTSSVIHKYQRVLQIKHF